MTDEPDGADDAPKTHLPVEILEPLRKRLRDEIAEDKIPIVLAMIEKTVINVAVLSPIEEDKASLIPIARQMMLIDERVPGFGEKFAEEVLSGIREDRALDRKRHERYDRSLNFGFWLGMAAIVACVICAWLGQPWVAVVLGGSGICAAVLKFIGVARGRE